MHGFINIPKMSKPRMTEQNVLTRNKMQSKKQWCCGECMQYYLRIPVVLIVKKI